MHDLTEYYYRQLCNVTSKLVDKTVGDAYHVNEYHLFQAKDYLNKLDQIAKRQKTFTIIREKNNNKNLTQRST